jgi:hypothetical protein
VIESGDGAIRATVRSSVVGSLGVEAGTPIGVGIDVDAVRTYAGDGSALPVDWRSRVPTA